MEESIHGQDDVRTSLARPYVLRLYAQRASRGAGPRPPGLADVGAGHRGRRRRHPGRHRRGRRRRRLGAGHRPHRRRPADRGLAARAGLRRAPSSTSAGWCRSCSTRSAPGAGCCCCATRRRSRPAGRTPTDGDLTRARPHLPLPRPASASRRPALRDVSLTLRPGPVVRADRPDRLGQVDAGQGADPGGRRARAARSSSAAPTWSTWTSRRCAGGSPSCRSAPRSWPARWPRTSPCSTRTCSTPAAPGAGRARPDRLGRRPAGRHARPGSATAGTCSPPGRSSWSRSPGSWSATRTW